MESEERMILRDMPVETRNYMIIDNITGKPIDQNNYTLSIDNEVIGKLNKLKKINEEKVKQASLKEKYENVNITSTFTPDDNAVFTPVYNDEYINIHDFNNQKEEKSVKENFEKDTKEEPVKNDNKKSETSNAEVIKSDKLLDRVVARDPSIRKHEQEEAEARAKAELEPKEELDYITNYVPTENEQKNVPTDNSVFTSETAGLKQASEQIIKINPDKLGGDIKATKKQKKGTENINLDRMEIISGKFIAWTAYILFFIPLLLKRKNRFVRIHANEGLELNIVELFSGLMIAQYFLLPKLIENISDKLSMISFVLCTIGAGLLVGCLISAIVGIITALLGKNTQTPWLWKRRILHVPTERTID